MENSTFKVLINAPREKVWDTLLSETNYPKWSAVFCEGSHAVTDWKEGSKALFLDNKKQGMVATIAKNVPNEFLSIKPLGEIKDGVEDYDSPTAKQMAGMFENYTLTADGDKTLLVVELSGEEEIPQEFKDFLLNVWPKAMDNIKAIAEEREKALS
jgi:uncharacterized protein YndB with AHSA1/START domain